MRTEIIVTGDCELGEGEGEGAEVYIEVLLTGEREVDRENPEPVCV